MHVSIDTYSEKRPSLIDAFPFQWGWGFGFAGPYCDPGRPEFACVCDLSVSMPAGERVFGQGVRAHFDTFVVTTTTDRE
jgi:hypothetical protein